MTYPLVTRALSNLAAVESDHLNFTNKELRPLVAEIRRAVNTLVVGINSLGTFNVKAYGAVGNGTTDDTQAFLQAASDAKSNGGGEVFLPPGRYVLEGQLPIYNGVSIVGSGIGTTTLDFTHATDSAFPQKACIFGTGTLTDLGGNAIATTVAAGANTLTLNYPITAAQGDYLLIYDTADNSFSTARAYYRNGEYIQLAANVTAGTALTLVDGLRSGYTGGTATIHLYKASLITTHLEGFSAIGFNSSVTSVIQQTISAHSSIQRVYLTGSKVGLFVLTKSVDCTIFDVSAVDINPGVLNYGVSVSNSQQVIASGCKLAAGRHGFDLGGDSDPGSIPNRNVILANSMVTNSQQAGVFGCHMHGLSEWIYYINNEFPQGYYLAGDHTRCLNNIVQSGRVNVNDGFCCQGTELLGADHLISGGSFTATMPVTPGFALVYMPMQAYLTRPDEVMVMESTIDMGAYTGQPFYVLSNGCPQNNKSVVVRSPSIKSNDTSATQSFMSIEAATGEGFRSIVIDGVTLRRIGLRLTTDNARDIVINNVTSIESSEYGIHKTANPTPIWSEQRISVKGYTCIESTYTGCYLVGESQTFSECDVSGTIVNSAATPLSSADFDTSLYAQNFRLVQYHLFAGDNRGSPKQANIVAANTCTNVMGFLFSTGTVLTNRYTSVTNDPVTFLLSPNAMTLTAETQVFQSQSVTLSTVAGSLRHSFDTLGNQFVVCARTDTIIGATFATPIVIQTSAAHKRVTGSKVSIAGVVGNTAANGTWSITVTDGTHYSLDTSMGNAGWVSGGIATSAPVGAQGDYTVTNHADRYGMDEAAITLPQLANVVGTMLRDEMRQGHKTGTVG